MTLQLGSKQVAFLKSHQIIGISCPIVVLDVQYCFAMLKCFHQIIIRLRKYYRRTLAGKLVNQRRNLAAPCWCRRRAGIQQAATQQQYGRKPATNQLDIYPCRSARRIPSSRSCLFSTSEGASDMRQAPFCVLGKAITSRIESLPVNSMIRRSIPKAIPPWGGVPKSNASSRKPNLLRADSSDRPSSLNIN